MSSGYTPVFSSVFTGTLCGRYPDTAAWLFLLALADKEGVVDMTPEYISNVTGMPVADLMACINRFMEPDPRSRSPVDEGRRLTPLNKERDWGWRIVNHGLYRERARLMAKSQREVSSGANSARMEDRRRPPETAGHARPPPPTPSHTQTHTQTKTKNEEPSLRSGRAPARSRSKTRRVPEDFQVTEEMRKWAREVSPSIDIERETEAFRDHEFRDAHSDWNAAWRQWMRRAPDFKRNGGNGFKSEDTGWRPSK